jgi:hypothetical protein
LSDLTLHQAKTKFRVSPFPARVRDFFATYYRYDLLGNGIQGVSQDALERNAPSLKTATMPTSPACVKTMPATDLATSVVVETAMPIYSNVALNQKA